MASLGHLWNRRCKILKEEVGVKPVQPPNLQTLEDLIRSFESMDNETFGKTLRALIEVDLPREAVIIWSCVVWSLRHETLCPEAVNDFGMALAITSLTAEEDATRWREAWKRIAPRRRIVPNLIYDSEGMYSAILQVGGARTLKDILREVILYVRSGSEISLTDYVKLMIQRLRRLELHLSETDKRVLQTILDNPGKRIRELASLMGVTASYFSQRINLLRERQVLLEFDHVPFSKIGIKMFNVLLKSSYNKRDAIHLIENSPFLYGYRHVLAGEWDVLALFCIPETWLIPRWLHRFVRLAKQWGVTVTLSEITQSESSTSLSYYDPNGEGWNIPWSALGLWCERWTRCDKQGEGMLLTPYGQRNMRLDELDMKILSTIRRGIRGFKAIRREVGGGQNVVAERIKTLRKNGFIVKYVQLLHVGLREGAMIETRDSEMKEILLRLGPRLPRAIISMDRVQRVIMTTNLPEGGCVELLDMLESRRDTFSFASLGDNIYGGWVIPTDSWNPATQSWVVPEEQVERWFDGLR